LKILKKSGVALVLVGAAYLSLTPAAFAQDMFQADLEPLNNSGASGTADLALEGDQLTANIASEGLAPNLPHAQHIHGLEQAMSECPTILNDQNGDNLINTTEGDPSYGPILTSFTTEGDTSPESGLAVDRFPVADENGNLTYGRTFGVPTNVAERLGDFAVVQHGVDLNGNGVYDFEAAGASDLDPNLPQEATLPANCGTIEPVSG
jgi:hypothetical protein